MSHDPKPTDAQPGKGAAGDQWAVQTAQSTDVNAPDAVIPSGNYPEDNQEDIQAAKASEEDSDLKTTDGLIIDESGKMDNFAIEPPMYVEDK